MSIVRVRIKGYLELGPTLGQITLFGKYSLSSSLFIHADMETQTDKQSEVSPISPILDANPFTSALPGGIYRALFSRVGQE